MVAGRVLVGGNHAHTGSSSTYVTLGRLPDWPRCPPEQVLTCSHRAAPTGWPGPRFGAVERHGRRAGGLAATFTPVAASSEIVLSVPIASPATSSVYVPGLTAQFAEAVLQAFEELGASPSLARLGAGFLQVSAAWWHEVDSGVSSFRDLPAKLVGVLTLPAGASGEEVWATWRDQDEALELAKLIEWMSSITGCRPDLALFGPGASPGTLAEVETSLGFPIPEPLRRLLLCVNGGRFAEEALAPPPARAPRPRYRLLPAEEIAPAYFSLAASQDPHGEAPLSTPDRPMFRLHDGTAVAWPFLPVAKDSDSERLLVLEVLPFPYSNRIQLADPLLPWVEWPVLHQRFLEFLKEFLGFGSRLSAAPPSGPGSQ